MQYHAAKLIDNSVPRTILIWLFSYIPSYLPLASPYVLLRWEEGGGRQLRATYPATLSEFPSAFKIFTCTFPSTDHQIIQGRIPGIIVCTDAENPVSSPPSQR